MYKNAKFVAMFFSLVSFSLLGDEPQKADRPTAPHSLRASLRHIEGNGIGYDTGYTTLEIFGGNRMGDSLPFADLRGHLFDNGKYAFNAGVGYRQQCHCRIYGGNIFYDYRQVEHQNYKQIGAGLESLGEKWDFRLNGYLPIGAKQSSWFHPRFAKFKGNHFFIREKQDFSMKGASAEAGYHLPAIQSFSFYAALGPYYFAGKGKNAYGGQLRLSGKYKEYVAIEGNTSYDNVFHDIYQGQVVLSLPFGPKMRVKQNTTSCNNQSLFATRMVQPVFREEIIVVDDRHKNFIAINPATGLPWNFLFVDNTSHSLGTFESPYSTLLAAQNASAPNDVIYVFPGDNTTTGMDQGFLFQDNQRLLGASFPYQLETTLGVITIPSFASERPQITNLGGDVILLANNNQVSGLTLLNDAGNGIVNNTAISELAITNNVIQEDLLFIEPSSDAIQLNNVSGTVVIGSNAFVYQIHGVAITSANIQNTNYFIEDNTALRVAYPATVSITDSSHVGTYFAGNVFTSPIATFPSIEIVYNDALPPAVAHFVSFTNNTITSDRDSIFLGFGEQTAGSVSITGNTLQSLSRNSVNFQVASVSTTPLLFSMYDNTCVAARNGVNIEALHNPLALTTDIRQNTIEVTDLAYNGINIVLGPILNGAGGTLTGEISDNNITLPSHGSTNIFVDARGSTVHDIAISNNTLSNGFFGVIVRSISTLTDNSHVSASVESNTISNAVGNGVLLLTDQTNTSQWLVSDNVFLQNALAVLVQTSDTATTCLQFTGNAASPQLGAYSLVQDSAGVFNLEPLIGNIGQVVISGAGVITNVPAGTCN